MGSQATVPSLLSKVRWPDLLFVSTAAAVAIGFVLRTMHADAPLWLDETATGAIAAEPSLAGVLHLSLQEINAPLYYVIAHYWSLLFGLSNQSLHFSAFVFAIIAPLLCLIPAPGMSRRASLLWCGLMALWIPGLNYAQEARCYSLLFCLSAATTIAYLWLIEKPTIRRAVVWACCAAAAIATHYCALILIGVQGLVYLYLWRRVALRTWPAVFVFLPIFAWLAIHAQRIAVFTDPQVAWYPLMTPARLVLVLGYIAGSFSLMLMLLVLTPLGALAARFSRSTAAVAEDDGLSRAWLAAATAAIGAALLIALAFWRPSFADRYLIAFMPGILLGLALIFGRLRRFWRLAPIFLLATFAVEAVQSSRHGLPGWKDFEFETASHSLMAAGTKKLVFFWDNPNTAVEDPALIDGMGGFFFRRAGLDVTVTAVKVVAGEDPNRALLAAADAPDSGILWIYDRQLRRTAAIAYPPNIPQLDPTWRCHDFGIRSLGVIACSRKAI